MTQKTRLDKLAKLLQPKEEEQNEEMISFIVPINSVYGTGKPDDARKWPKSRYEDFIELLEFIYSIYDY